MTGSADRALLVAAGRGDESCFDLLVRRHTARMYRVAVRIVADPADAEDVVQDAWLAAWRGLRSYRGEAEPSTWLYRVVTNTGLAHLRRRRRTVSIDERLQEVLVATEEPDVPESAAVRTEQAALVQAAVAELEPSQRVPLVLHEFEGLSYEEVAAVLDISVAAVGSRLHRARERLLGKLRELR